MAFNSNVVNNLAVVEYGKFVEIVNDSKFPPISVIRTEYADSSNGSLTALSVYPKYAVLTYLANPEDIKVSLSAENINVNLQDVENILNVTNTLLNSVSSLLGNQLGINGIQFCQPSDGAIVNNFNAVQVVSACKFSQIGIRNSSVSSMVNYELPQNFTFTAPITSLTLSYGALIAFK